MSGITRHTGVVRSTGSRVFVLWRQQENDPDHCLVIYRDSLPEAYANKVTELVLREGQSSIDLWDVMDKVGVLEGGHMLSVLHTRGYIRKQNTQDIDMHIGGNNKIPLDVLNREINESAAVVSGTVKDFNPFNQQSTVQYPEKDSIVSRLLDEARKYEQLARENYERAYSLDPSLRPVVHEVLGEELETVHEEPKLEVAQPEVEQSFTIEFPDNISQTKAIELVKNTIKERAKDAK